MPDAQRSSPQNNQEKLQSTLDLLFKYRWSIGYFLRLLFSEFDLSEVKEDANGQKYKRTHRHASFVHEFLSDPPNESSPSDIVSLIYNHKSSVPIKHRATANGPAQPDKDHKPMARYQLLLWARQATLECIQSEIVVVVKQPQLRLSDAETNWEAISEFSFAPLRECIQSFAPTFYSLFMRMAIPSEQRSGGPRDRNPRLIALVSMLMVLITHNSHTNLFQRLIGVCLFSCTAPVEIYRIASRFGLSVGYTTVIRMLTDLADASITSTQLIASQQHFLIIIDNVNHKRKHWQPHFGQQDTLMSGTASTLVELVGFEESAFDPAPVLDARTRHLRRALTAKVLWDRIDWTHLGSIMALHCLNFLVKNCMTLSNLSEYVTTEFRTTYAIHRMPDGHRTKAHPLSASNINEGSAEGCRDALEDILIHQLGLSPETINKIMILVGGDLGSIEKIRALINLSTSCPHGYASFRWVLPLVQLWHMGWADLARILATHWGKPVSRDPSTFWHNCNLLGRSVKPVDRPEYYPTQQLVFETLEADVLDCWRLLLQTDDFDSFFKNNPRLCDGPALFELANQLVAQWATTRAHYTATHSDKFWTGPRAQADPQRHNIASDFKGDHVLANSIVRMHESLWHYEFIYAVADGDIGRAMQIMSVWQFTFTGSKASKYSTELLELACGFLYEFPEPLKTTIKNNWLCNFSGLQGCWFPMDLMQEHHIRELKNKSQRRDEDFGGIFFQKVVARNTRWLTLIRTVINREIQLENRSTSHGHSKRAATLNRLCSSLATELVHSFVPGRSSGKNARRI